MPVDIIQRVTMTNGALISNVMAAPDVADGTVTITIVDSSNAHKFYLAIEANCPVTGIQYPDLGGSTRAITGAGHIYIPPGYKLQFRCQGGTSTALAYYYAGVSCPNP